MTKTRIISALGVLILLAFGPVVHAAEATFLPGLRVGIVPIDGLKPATDFVGFASDDKNVKVGLAEIPEAAFAAIEAAVKDNKTPDGKPKPQPFETAARQAYYVSETGMDGTTPVQNYSLLVPGNKFTGYVIVQVRAGAGDGFSEEAIKKMLATTVTRPEVPVDEQLAQLAFKVNELAGFKTVRTIAPRSAVLLSDGDDDSRLDSAPYMMIGLVQGAPEQTDDRGRYARDTAASIPGLRDSRMTSNEPLRIDGSPGFETRIEGVAGKDNTPITVVQWLRFGGSQSTLRIIASATKDEWPKAFPRFRAVRDGISAK